MDAARKNMQLTYELKNEALKIKSKTMSLLYKQVELLAEEAQKCDDEKLLRILEVMAMLGQAIVPD